MKNASSISTKYTSCSFNFTSNDVFRLNESAVRTPCIRGKDDGGAFRRAVCSPNAPPFDGLWAKRPATDRSPGLSSQEGS